MPSWGVIAVRQTERVIFMKTGMRADGKILAVLCIVLMLLTGCGVQKTPTPSSDGVDYNQYLNSPGYYACTDTAWYICYNLQFSPSVPRRIAIIATGRPAVPTCLLVRTVSLVGTIRCIFFEDPLNILELTYIRWIWMAKVANC